MQYNGTSAETIVVLQKKDNVEIFNSVVQPGDLFTIYGEENDGTMGTEISLYIGGQLDTKIHTSCSKPIGPGLIAGNFLVISGYSLDGGLLCPIPDCLECDGKVNDLTLQYTGTSAKQIKVIQDKGTVELFNQLVQPGDYFQFVGTDGANNSMGTKIYMYIDCRSSAKVGQSFLKVRCE